MNIRKLVLATVNKLRAQPSYCFFVFIDILAIVIYLPRYLCCMLRKQKIICFAWGNGEYSDSFLPLFYKLNDSNLKVLFFFHFYAPRRYSMTIFKKGLPRVYADVLDDKLVLCAGSSKFKNLFKTTRIQLFHAPASFGGSWQRDIIDNFDALFMVTKYQWFQCTEGKFTPIAEKKKLFQTGYPKIDKYFSSNCNYNSHDEKPITLFYGPTYHREISSIFDFLPVIVQICKQNNYRLIVKLHPFLYHKYNYAHSGSIDWYKQVKQYQKQYNELVFINGRDDNLGKYFEITDCFLTDTSGLGFEFVLVTGRPILFLGNKLKIPLEDLRSGNTDKYKQLPEIYYRGTIGSIVENPQTLEQQIKKTLEKNHYVQQIQKFQKEYVFNLGSAAEKAVCQIKQLYQATK